MRKSVWIAKFASDGEELVTFQDFVEAANREFDGLRTTASGNSLQMANDKVSLVLKLQDVNFQVEIVDLEDPLERKTYISSHVPDAWKEFLLEEYEGSSLNEQREELRKIMKKLESNDDSDDVGPTKTSSRIRLVASALLDGRVTVAQASRKLRVMVASCGSLPRVLQPMESVLLVRVARASILSNLEEERIRRAVKSMDEYGAQETMVDGRPAMVAEIEGFKVTATVYSISYYNDFSVVGWESVRQTGITKDPVGVLDRWVNARNVQDALMAMDIRKKSPLPADKTIPSPPPSFD